MNNISIKKKKIPTVKNEDVFVLKMQLSWIHVDNRYLRIEDELKI